MLNHPHSALRLSNGTGLPCLSFGTWHLTDPDEARRILHGAIEAGYRSFDSAQIYNNTKYIGEAIAHSGLPREAFFLTSKIWVTHHSYEGTIEAVKQILEDFRTSYLDSLLIHWPSAHGDPLLWQSRNAGTWRAFEALYDAGLVRAIGVSNFLPHHLVPLLSRARIAPMINQLEIHAGYPQAHAVNFCRRHGIIAQSWGPFGRGQLLANEKVLAVAKRHGVTTSQVLLRWCLDQGLPTIPRSHRPEHFRENLDVFHFTLEAEEIEALSTLDTTGFSGLHPDTVSF